MSTDLGKRAALATERRSRTPRALAIELHDDQIAVVLQHADAARNELWELMMTAVSDPLSLNGLEEHLASTKVSHTLLRGLWLFVRMQAHGGWIGVSELACETGVASSTVHRYLTTLLVFGLIEQHQHSRRYRVRQIRPLPSAATA